ESWGVWGYLKGGGKVDLSCPAGAAEIDVEIDAPAERGACCPRANRASKHGKPEVNTCVLGSAMRGGNRFPDLGKGNFPGLVSKLRHSCNTFRGLSDRGPYRPGSAEFFWLPNLGWRTRKNRLWGAPRA